MVLSIGQRLKHFLLCHFVSMYYFQEYVDRFGVYYDRRRYRRVYEDAPRCALEQYRRLNGNENLEVEYPLTLSKWTIHIQLPTVFFALYLLRCLAILRVPAVTDSRLKRIWIGAEMFGKEDFYFESSFVFWSIIVFSFYRLGLTERLLDYKFLAVLRMSDDTNSKATLKATDFGLEATDYRRFDSFRFRYFLMYLGAVGSLHSTCPLAAASLMIRTRLYWTHLLPAILWTVLVSIWCFYVTTVLYSNYISLVVVAKYLYIKQRSVIATIELCLSRLRTNRLLLNLPSKDKATLRAARAKAQCLRLWQQFLRANTRYAHLQMELADYNRFWSGALSYFCLTYVLLVSFIIFIVFISKTTIWLKLLYSLILLFHVILLSTILKFCGDLVRRNEQLVLTYHSALTRLAGGCLLPAGHALKMNNMGQYLLQTQSGFTLLNGYILNHDSFRDIIGGIAVYFMLILKQ